MGAFASREVIRRYLKAYDKLNVRRVVREYDRVRLILPYYLDTFLFWNAIYETDG